MTRILTFALVAAALATAVQRAQAAFYINEDFSTYSNGNLVGQNGWTQLGAVNALPLQVTGGTVVIPPGQSADSQDAWKSMSAIPGPTPTIPAPAVGTTSIFYQMSISVQTAAPSTMTSPFYFAAIYNNSDASGFANERVTARDDGAGGFVFGARITGQGADPFNWGATSLSYNTFYNLVVEVDMVAGAANDVMKLFVNPTNGNLAAQTPYLVHPIGGAATDPTGVGALVISQFATTLAANDGVTIGGVRVADTFSEASGLLVPEPSTMLLAGMGLLALVACGRNRLARLMGRSA